MGKCGSQAGDPPRDGSVPPAWSWKTPKTRPRRGNGPAARLQGGSAPGAVAGPARARLRGAARSPTDPRAGAAAGGREPHGSLPARPAGPAQPCVPAPRGGRGARAPAPPLARAAGAVLRAPAEFNPDPRPPKIAAPRGTPRRRSGFNPHGRLAIRPSRSPRPVGAPSAGRQPASGPPCAPSPARGARTPPRPVIPSGRAGPPA